ALQDAYDNDELRVLKVVFPSGNGFYVLMEVRQSSWSAATSAVVGATYSLRVKGKPKRIRVQQGS
ncbi:phage tail protein, partial [Xanthomonas citri pv. citri]|nr:phage tail protein [Xanthomonas citri pv. citri]